MYVYIYIYIYIYIYNYIELILTDRLEPIMLLKLPIINYAFEHYSKINPIMLKIMLPILGGSVQFNSMNFGFSLIIHSLSRYIYIIRLLFC